MVLLGNISVFVCQTISPKAVGSGVPQVKTVLSGVRIYRFLEMKVLFAKLIALVFSAASGVGTGIEGPLIHMSAAISYNLSKINYFKNIG